MNGDWTLPGTWGPWLLLAALPLLLAGCTAFTKVSVVVAAIRVGLGAELLLPMTAMLALSLAMTAIVMFPVGVQVVEAWSMADPVAPTLADLGVWWQRLEPLRAFMLRFADPDEVAFFADLSGLPAEHPATLVPAFLVSELTSALMLAALILIPFVLVDLVVAQLLTLCSVSLPSMAVVTLPLKLLLFLSAGGFSLVLGNLMAEYGP